MRKLKFLFVCVTLSLLTGGVVLAMSSSNYQILWQSLFVGGGDRSSANYTLSDTVGQSATGSSQSSSYQLETGFWSGATIPLLVAETSLAEGLSSNVADVLVVDVNIDRIKDPSDNSTANITGGIGSYTA
ncbi:hypothetical protein ACFLUJ_00005, partial [Chloroflexota bacterium]